MNSDGSFLHFLLYDEFNTICSAFIVQNGEHMDLNSQNNPCVKGMYNSSSNGLEKYNDI